MTPRILVIGARRARQGIGPFVAGWFQRLGGEVAGIVGTSEDTVAAASRSLRAEFGIDCKTYVRLDEALDGVRPDAVAICSPNEAHRVQLEHVAAAGVDCLCDKPLWWADGVADPDTITAAIVDAFVEHGRLLRLITQWPCTLPWFFELYPGQRGRPVEAFEMRLCPRTSGLQGMVDAAPHLLSMLRHLLGPGRIGAVEMDFLDADLRRSRTRFEYVHARGRTSVRFDLEVKEQPPRPATYAINGDAVSRRIEQPDYRQYFDGGGKSLEIVDPLRLLVAEFIDDVHTRAVTDRAALIEGHEALITLVHAAHNAAGRATRKNGEVHG